MRKEIPEEKKRFAVARILAKKSSAAEEAEKLGVSEQAVRAWVRKMRPPESVRPPEKSVSPSLQSPGASPPPGSSNSAAPGAEPPPEDPLDRARAAAGIAAGAGSAAPLPNADALRAAEQADKELVISTALDAKRAIVTFVGVKAGLDPEDPALETISGLTPIAASALQANASWLAPMIREKLQGKFALLGALAIEAVVTLAALKKILKARGLDKDEETDEKKPDGSPPPK